MRDKPQEPSVESPSPRLGFETRTASAWSWLLRPAFPPVAFAAVFLVLFGYARTAGNWLTVERFAELIPLGHLALALALLFFGLGASSAFIQLRRLARTTAMGAREPGALTALGGPLLSRRGRRVFAGVFAIYFPIFSWATSVLIIRPGEDFTATYGVPVPSVLAIPCCGPVGAIPQYNVYVAQGLGLLITPTTLLLSLSVSLLAALSITLSLGSLAASRATSKGTRSAVLAGATGFLASCPTCAGQVLLAAIVGPGSAAVAAALSPWQLYLALTSLGVLLTALWAQGRWIAKARRVCLAGTDVSA